jgi:hypothetical protein
MSDKKEKDEIESKLEWLYEEVEKAANSNGTGELGSILTADTLLEESVELPHHSDLPPEQRDMYVRYDSRRCPNQHWGTRATVTFALKLARRWRDNKHQPVIHFGDISAKNFAKTNCHTAHKTGTHLDVDLPTALPSDPSYDKGKRKLCATLCWYAVSLGARRVLFSDPAVAEAVNKLAQASRLVGRVVVRDDHDNHFHIEM